MLGAVQAAVQACPRGTYSVERRDSQRKQGEKEACPPSHSKSVAEPGGEVQCQATLAQVVLVQQMYQLHLLPGRADLEFSGRCPMMPQPGCFYITNNQQSSIMCWTGRKGKARAKWLSPPKSGIGPAKFQPHCPRNFHFLGFI